MNDKASIKKASRKPSESYMNCIKKKKVDAHRLEAINQELRG